MKKIVLLGLNNLHNYGENFILQSLQYVIGQTGKTCKIVDVNSESVLKKIVYYFMILCSKILPKSTLRYKTEFCAVSFRNRAYYRKNLRDAEALIFGLGSFKYGTQKLWAYFGIATVEAQKLGIPVMYNGANIQRFNRTDYKCQILHKYVQYPCVKMITSRDGIKGVERLRKDYLVPDRIQCLPVGDIAFWIPECYNVSRNQKSKVVGINLIDGRIFRRYGYHLTEEALLDYYYNILKLLDSKGIQWQLFTNGLSVDYKFGLKLAKKYGGNKDMIHVPHSDSELVYTIKEYGAVLGARLHACICAYSLDIPIVGLIWDEKLLNFSELVEIRDCFYDENQINPSKMVEKINCLLRGHYQYNIVKRNDLKNKAKEAVEIFIKDYI